MPQLENNRRLDSWKEIADYLGRDVRTVIRWEQERNLPVHRTSEGGRQSVHAFADEIDAWLRGGKGEAPGQVPEIAAPAQSEPASAGRASSFAEATPRKPGIFRVAIALVVLAVLLLVLFLQFRGNRPDNAAAVKTYPLEFSVAMADRSISFQRKNIQLSRDEMPRGLRLVDLNGDGVLDLAFTSFSAGTIQTFFGKGDGSFHSPRSYGDCAGADFLDVADFDGDRIPDVAASCQDANSVVLLFGNGDGTFSRRKVISVPGGPRSIAVADFDHNGFMDLVVDTVNRPGLVLILNRRGTFTATRIIEAEDIGLPAVADLNEDGKPDLVSIFRQQGRITLRALLGKGDGTFDVRTVFDAADDIAADWGGSVVAADFNHDGHLDLAAVTYRGYLVLVPGGGNGKFSPARRLAIPRGGVNGKAMDLNGDSWLDLVISNTERGSITILAGRPSGVFDPPVEIPLGRYAYGVAAADLNGDHLQDLVVLLVHDRVLAILLQKSKTTRLK